VIKGIKGIKEYSTIIPCNSEREGKEGISIERLPSLFVDTVAGTFRVKLLCELFERMFWRE
jgi:hypothetical protein